MSFIVLLWWYIESFIAHFPQLYSNSWLWKWQGTMKPLICNGASRPSQMCHLVWCESHSAHACALSLALSLSLSLSLSLLLALSYSLTLSLSLALSLLLSLLSCSVSHSKYSPEAMFDDYDGRGDMPTHTHTHTHTHTKDVCPQGFLQKGRGVCGSRALIKCI